MKSRLLTTTFLAITACLLWSTAFVGVKIGLNYTTPLRFAGIRFFLAGLYILPFCGNLRNSLRMIVRNWKEVVRLGFFQTFLLYTFFYLGISRVPASLTAIIIGASPLFAAIFAHLLLQDDRLNVRKLGSISLGMAGVVIIAASRENFSWAEGKEFWGILILVAANVAGSIGNVVVVKYRKGLLLSLPFEGLHFRVNAYPYYLSLAWLSAMSATAFSIWFILLRRPGIKVSVLNIWKFLIPVFGAMLSWIILPGEKPEVIAVTGMILIALSLIVLNAGRLRENRINAKQLAEARKK